MTPGQQRAGAAVMSPRRDPLDIAGTVTRVHAEIFAREWIVRSFETGTIWDAFDATELVLWDDDDHELQGRYEHIQDEICERVAEAVKATIRDTFLTTARDVLRRERRAQK